MSFDFDKIHPASIQIKENFSEKEKACQGHLCPISKEELALKKYSFDPFFLLIFIIVIILIYESKFINIEYITINKIYILVIITIVIIEKFFI